MKEAYVSFETAKLLRKKGLSGGCVAYYNNDGKIYLSLNADLHPIPCPTQAVVCRWLREVHKIFIGVDIGEDIDGEFGYMPFVHILDNLSCSDGRYVPHVDADDICDFTPQTYEDAVEAALEYALKNLI